MLDRNIRAKTFWRTSVLLPYVMAPVAVALIFSNMFGDNHGLVNNVLTDLGLPDMPGREIVPWTDGTVLVATGSDAEQRTILQLQDVEFEIRRRRLPAERRCGADAVGVERADWLGVRPVERTREISGGWSWTCLFSTRFSTQCTNRHGFLTLRIPRHSLHLPTVSDQMLYNLAPAGSVKVPVRCRTGGAFFAPSSGRFSSGLSSGFLTAVDPPAGPPMPGSFEQLGHERETQVTPPARPAGPASTSSPATRTAWTARPRPQGEHCTMTART